ncbi:hypothetical protein QJS10_CPA01g00764 [Acorus calamus]|uniref:Uncharacterized protein n=1 Tax=Acorus calamus TaxID=4465 RepID=A0AAV9FJU8_ACOCL|nr:hypothetical protein QJS10_CPA01g00764 [Acorus calamus]
MSEFLLSRMFWKPRSGEPSEEGSNVIAESDSGKQGVHLVVWIDCLDLRVLAVLANSTLSKSRSPGNIHFHFFIPEGEDEKLSYYKLKVVFPHSNLKILGQKEVKDHLKLALSKDEVTGPFLHEIAPFIIQSVHPSLSRFIYVSPYTIVKGNIEELFGVDMGDFGVALVEDNGLFGSSTFLQSQISSWAPEKVTHRINDIGLYISYHDG